MFLGRTAKAPQVRRVDRASKSKIVHIIRVTHRDEVEAPITDWLQEAYDLPERLAATPKKKAKVAPKAKRTATGKRKVGAKKTKRR